MSNYLYSCKSDKVSTSNTLPDSFTKHNTLVSHNTESSAAVANCIRGLNNTIEKLTKENTYLRKSLEEFNTTIQKPQKKGKKLKELQKTKENNEKLEKEILNLKENNSELHERYNRVKEMYDLLVEKQIHSEDVEKLRKKAVESEALSKANKKLKEANNEYLIEIESLNEQVSGLKLKIKELQDSRKFILDEHKKSGEFVNEIAKINEELLRYIEGGKRSCKKAESGKVYKAIRKVVSERGSFGKISVEDHSKQ